MFDPDHIWDTARPLRISRAARAPMAVTNGRAKDNCATTPSRELDLDRFEDEPVAAMGKDAGAGAAPDIGDVKVYAVGLESSKRARLRPAARC